MSLHIQSRRHVPMEAHSGQNQAPAPQRDSDLKSRAAGVQQLPGVRSPAASSCDRNIWKELRRKRWRGFNNNLCVCVCVCVCVQEAACAYVIALMAVYWCTEVLPLAVTALLPTILFPVLGIMESKDVCMQYLKDTNMLFVGGLMVAVAVEHWNLHKRIALKVLLLVGVRPALLMLGFMGVTAFLSMWISNTATTAMMVPIVQAVLDQLHSNVDPGPWSKSQGRTAVPHQEHQEETISDLKNAAPHVLQKGLNGSIETQEKTTSPRDDVSVEHEEMSELETDGRVQPTPRDKPPSDAGGGAVDTGCCPVELEELSDVEEETRTMSKGLLLSVCYAASIGGIATLTGTGPNLVLIGQMSQLFPQNGDVINFASWFVFAFPIMVLMLTLAWFWLQFLYIGCNLRRTWGCGAVQSEKERAAYNVIRDEHRRLGPMSYGECSVLALFILMVVLWFTRDPRFMDGWATHMFNAKAEFVTDATVSLFVAVLLFVLPSEPPRYLCCWRSSDSESRVSRGPAPPLLTWQVTQRKMPWNIVLLLGGGFALAKGSEESGLSRWLGTQMTPLQSIPPWAICIILCLLVAIFTECASNVATATLFLPILASMSQSMGLNPLYVMIPCTLSASFAFMLPVATPPNAIVFSYGLLKVSDMARTGVVMNVIAIGCISLAINSWGRVMFSLDTFPSWANATLPV
ncbi:putative solute carrier family 13 member 5-like [Scophthalmus maximus]|uniref:Putative solute carrier family 13 member 5-like n=1 Tax=Scophthalmus maximus TaxID=52904 RepID=A0A2U9B6R9_SCOMX|nr:putative solute carrier family 13 member 5-like [Scophthalmus maximus]